MNEQERAVLQAALNMRRLERHADRKASVREDYSAFCQAQLKFRELADALLLADAGSKAAA